MIFSKKLAVLAFAAALSAPGSGAAAPAPKYSPISVSGFLPTAADWQEHAGFLEKFWLHPTAFGIPEGKFPTWRCNDGSLITPEHFVCPDEGPQNSNARMPDILKLDFVRMISRQTFAYGALFNLTGNPECLGLHQAGVRYLLEYARDPAGVFYTTIDSAGHGTPKAAQRNAQDLAYALVGLAMNAYLTHDPRVISTIVRTERYIFANYYDRENHLMKWVLEDSDSDKTDQKELVAVLDQLNAYMLLVWTLVPESEMKDFSADIAAALKSMNRYYLHEDGLSFRGCLDRPECSGANARHSDYGHTVKGFTMELLAASRLGDRHIREQAVRGMLSTVNRAATPDGREWYENPRNSGASWWVYAELDQAALTLNLEGKYEIQDQLRLWLGKYTDRKYGEVRFGRKQHLWRNGMHSSEHALWGYIMSQGIRERKCLQERQCSRTEAATKDLKTVLYFSESANPARVYPYQFSGDIAATEKLPGGIIRVSFKNIRLPDRLENSES